MIGAQGGFKFIVCVDFDGTMHREDFPEVGEPDVEALKALRELKEMGGYIIIWSGRNNSLVRAYAAENGLNDPVEVMRMCLAKWGADYHEIDVGINGKMIADFYIDDRSVPSFRDIGWQGVIEYINDTINLPDFVSVIEKLDL